MAIDQPPAELFGWAGEEEAKRAWDQIGHLFPSFMIVGDSEPYKPGGRYMLWEIVRKVLGKDIPNIAQQVGDCVSWGAKHAVEQVSCVEILRGEPEEFKLVFAPYLYGTGRVQIGGGTMRGDGSVGSWQAKAVETYGILNEDADGVPPYSGTIARQWGNPPGPPKKFLELGKKHLIRTTAPVYSWEDLVMALRNGYPCTIASSQGFEMLPRKDGFHWPSGSWPHQMDIAGVDDNTKDPYVDLHNSWGDVHGHLVDFITGEKWPVGRLRVRRQTIERMIKSGECISYSQFDGFQAQSELLWSSII